MSREVIKTTGAPAALAVYSQGIVASGKFVFAAGQVGLDPETKEMVEGGIEAQTERVLLNVKAIVEAAGSSLENVVKATVFLHDINDFAAMNSVYARYFPTNPPARSAFGGNNLPLGALVEIEVIAVVPE
jgi:2-iminobutanoate/2-iminopropanoate deaminase